MVIKGRVWKFGRDIDTDVIIPAKFLVTTDEKELGKSCFADSRPEFTGEVQKGDIIVAEENFGCGSSREHAPIAIKGAGISLVIATSFARIFYRNAINIGLPILECDGIARETLENDSIEADLSSGVVKNLRTNKEFRAVPYPDFLKDIINSGGLVNWAADKVKDKERVA